MVEEWWKVESPSPDLIEFMHKCINRLGGGQAKQTRRSEETTAREAASAANKTQGLAQGKIVPAHWTALDDAHPLLLLHQMVHDEHEYGNERAVMSDTMEQWLAQHGDLTSKTRGANSLVRRR